MSRNKRNKAGKGPAFQPKGNLVVQARAELNRTVLALRHSNAIAAYLLSLVDGSVRIPKKLYVELLADDNTTMKWAEDGDDMVITMPVKPIKVDYAEVERRAAAHMVANATPEERMAVKNKLMGVLYGGGEIPKPVLTSRPTGGEGTES
jgi:hypothetical protein